MSKSGDWRNYVNVNGDFELPNYLFRMNTELMKQALDMGTLLSEDPAKLRAFKEQIKKHFKARWIETAQALEYFDLVVRCRCKQDDYCEVCGGSRYLLNMALSPDQMREVAFIYGAQADSEIAEKLQKGLVKALKELETLNREPLSKV